MSDLRSLLEKGNDLARIIDLRMAQLEGELPPAGKITQEQLAKALGMSRTHYRRLEAVALAKAAAKLGGLSTVRALLHSIPSEH
jgi:AraC-like DNA-binding protein